MSRGISQVTQEESYVSTRPRGKQLRIAHELYILTLDILILLVSLRPVDLRRILNSKTDESKLSRFRLYYEKI